MALLSEHQSLFSDFSIQLYSLLASATISSNQFQASITITITINWTKSTGWTHIISKVQNTLATIQQHTKNHLKHLSIVLVCIARANTSNVFFCKMGKKYQVTLQMLDFSSSVQLFIMFINGSICVSPVQEVCIYSPDIDLLFSVS